jgi:hypothetical protein
MKLILAGKTIPPQSAIDVIMNLNPTEYVVSDTITGGSLKQWAVETKVPVTEFILELDRRGFSALEYLIFEVLDYSDSLIAIGSDRLLSRALVAKARARGLMVLDYSENNTRR